MATISRNQSAPVVVTRGVEYVKNKSGEDVAIYDSDNAQHYIRFSTEAEYLKRAADADVVADKKIYSQSPGASELVAPGTKINLVLTDGRIKGGYFEFGHAQAENLTMDNLYENFLEKDPVLKGIAEAYAEKGTMTPEQKATVVQALAETDLKVDNATPSKSAEAAMNSLGAALTYRTQSKSGGLPTI